VHNSSHLSRRTLRRQRWFFSLGRGSHGWGSYGWKSNWPMPVTCHSRLSRLTRRRSTLSTMSFARIIGLQPRILTVIARQCPSNNFYRLISSSSCFYNRHAPYPSLQSDLDEKVNRNRAHATQEHGSFDPAVNPYKNGPSAIDKAVHLFFLTEILRGAPIIWCWAFSLLNVRRNVDCYGELLSSSLYSHVSVRERTFISSFPWRTCITPLSQRRRALHW